MKKMTNRPLVCEILSQQKNQAQNAVKARIESLNKEVSDQKESATERLWWSER
ncbi:MAG: hypothetical protein WCF85_09555 [Rhodospirillaceae bacterium]